MACCPTRLADGATLLVDSVIGSDGAGCCGFGGSGPCQTLTRAMALISSTQARNVTLVATVDGGGGDWSPAGEIYPVQLGWGVELSAPGVFFFDLDGGNSATLSVQVAVGDTLGYASIVGDANDTIGVGLNQDGGLRTPDVAAISIANGATLYLADAVVNGPTGFFGVGSAIHVNAGGTLVLGQDQGNAVTGTVNIGTAVGSPDIEGFAGILVDTDGTSLGGTLKDVPLAGQSSVVIQGQAVGIYALDFSTVSLASAPVIGAAPQSVGFQTCPSTSDATGIALFGAATATIDNATIQCRTGFGVYLAATAYGGPTLTIDSSTIEHAGSGGIYAIGGAATVSNTTIRYNYIGVYQDTDGTNNGSIDLSGNGVGGNTVVCSSVTESPGLTNPGVDVYNSSYNNLDAKNVTWDSPGPDYFSCDINFVSCSCNIASCSRIPGGNGMSAVEDSSLLGGITTTGNLYSDAGC
jgi:hypothetical protein